MRPEDWSFPLEPGDVPRLFRRSRGLAVTSGPAGYVCEHEPYERRLQRALLKGRILLADWQFRHGDLARALRLYESVLALDSAAGSNEAQIHTMALCYLALGKPERAELFFHRVLELSARPWIRASSWLALGDLAKGRGDAPGAQRSYQEAARIDGLSPAQKAEVVGRLGSPQR